MNTGSCCTCRFYFNEPWDDPCYKCRKTVNNEYKPKSEEIIEKVEKESMKKLFISCPMKGRTEENIRKTREKMHKIAEVIFEQELEVIPSYIEDNPPKDNNEAIWYLGKTIGLMAQADYFIGVTYTCGDFKGCDIEHSVAIDYGIPSYFIDDEKLNPGLYPNEKFMGDPRNIS